MEDYIMLLYITLTMLGVVFGIFLYLTSRTGERVNQEIRQRLLLVGLIALIVAGVSLLAYMSQVGQV